MNISKNCGNCNFFGYCSDSNKRLTPQSHACEEWQALPAPSKELQALQDQIWALDFASQLNLYRHIGLNLSRAAQRDLKPGDQVGFGVGETKGWMQGKVLNVEGDTVIIQDNTKAAQTWKVWWGYVVWIDAPVTTQETKHE